MSEQKTEYIVNNMTSSASAKTQEIRLDHRGKPLPRTAWKPGDPSPNPTGRPAEGQSWAGIIRELSNMTAEELAAEVGPDTTMGKELLEYPHGRSFKKLVVVKVLLALAKEPSPGLWSSLMEKADGRLPLAVQVETPTLSPEQAQARILEIMERARARMEAKQDEQE